MNTYSLESIISNELYQDAISSYPYPIACRLLLAAKANADDQKLENLLECYSAILRYCAAIAISNYLYSNVANPAIDADIDELMGNTSLPQWERLLRKIVRTFTQIGQHMFMDELKEFLLVGRQLSTYGFVLKSWLGFFDCAKSSYGVSPEVFHTRCSQLRELVECLTFLKRYRLVQILSFDDIGSSEENRFTVKEWMGANPPVRTVKIGGSALGQHLQRRNEAMLALYNETSRELLSLYPFLICDLLTPTMETMDIREEIFFFNGRHEDSVSYYSVLYGLNGARVTQLYSTDLHYLTTRCIDGPERDSWQGFAHGAFKGQTRYSLADIRRARGKELVDVYLPRDNVEKVLQDFLADDKHTGLVIIGDSGVGKTSLLVHFAEDQLTNGDIVLFFRSGDLLDKLSLDEQIASVFSEVGTGEPNLQAILSHLERLRGDKGHVIVIFDGINEGADPRSLLKYINDLIRQVVKFLFVKIIISCHSSFWSKLGRMNLLDDQHLYHIDGHRELQITGFATEELQKAFELYRREYELKTTYEELSEKKMSRVKSLITDPLMLSLVAETYQARSIPADVSSVALFRKYCDIKLRGNDRRLIREVIRKMRQKARDYLTTDELYQGEQQIHCDGISSFIDRMIDLGVLQRTSSHTDMGMGGVETGVKFTYDRVHEYLLAEDEIQIVRERGGEYLVGLIEESKIYNPMWGATKSLLAMLSEEEGFEKYIAHLTSIDTFEVRSVLIDALTSIGRENPELMRGLLKGSTFLGSQVEAARLAAVRVACGLKMVDILADTATHAEATTREMTVQYIYWFWQRDRQAAEAFVQEIIKRTKDELCLFNLIASFLERGKVTDQMYALKTLIAITIMMSGHLALDVKRLQPIFRGWDSILRTYGIFRSVINYIAISYVIRVLETAMRSSVTKGFSSLRAFFSTPLGSPERKIALTLIRCLASEDVTPVKNDLLTLAAFPDMLIGNLLVGLLAIYSLKAQAEALALAEKIFNAGDMVSKFTALRAIWLASLLRVEGMILDKIPPDYICSSREMLLELWASGDEPVVTINEQTFRIGYEEYIIIAEYAGWQIEDTFIERFFQLPWNKQESIRTAYILHALEVAAQYGYPLQALNDMKRWFDDPDEVVHKAVVEALRKIRVTYPDEVDLYLTGYPELLKETAEMHSADWKGSGPGPAFYQAAMLAGIGMLKITELRRGLLAALAKAVEDAQCLEDAIRLLVKWVFNAALPLTIKYFRQGE